LTPVGALSLGLGEAVREAGLGRGSCSPRGMGGPMLVWVGEGWGGFGGMGMGGEA